MKTTQEHTLKMQRIVKPYFITTPIFYVNAKPHLGHVYSVLLADAQNRFQKLRKDSSGQTLFSTGTDEHGLKIQQAAVLNGHKNPKSFCDEVSSNFRETFSNFNVQNDDFIRTTEERHFKVVQHVWNDLNSKGLLHKKSYESWYCVQDESFLTEHQVDLTKKISLESGHPVEWATEENYVFKLEPFRERIRSWLDGKNVIRPNLFRSNLNMFLSEEMPDLSVSRSSSRLQWGIPVPNDSSQTIYVWLDALANYLTVSGYPENLENWPPNCHVIGKDILKFHAIYWPSFLMALELDLPERILCHSHWTVNDEKMSKSKGNVVDPNVISEELCTFEGLRYFLLKEGVPHSDGNFNQDQLVNFLNNDLADVVGNLLNRITASSVNLEQSFYKNGANELKTVEAEDLIKSLETLREDVEKHYEDFHYYLAIDVIMNCLRKVNGLITVEKPWELKKSDLDRLASVLNLSLESIRICSILLQPIIPGLCDKILSKLNISQNQRTFEHAVLSDSYDDHKLTEGKVMLFKKIKLNK